MRGLVAIGWVSVVALSAGGAGAGCSTVELGDPPADVNACRPSQQFFYERVCPEYLAASYGGKTCMDASCHGSMSNSALKITLASCSEDAPPSIPFVGGSNWLSSYLSASRVMNCTDVTGAALYTNPSGQAMHPGGKLFEPGGPEFDLLQAWVTSP